MKKAIMTTVVMTVLFSGSSVFADEASAQALIDQCRQEAESKGAENVQDYIGTCLDEIMQYDTSE